MKGALLFIAIFALSMLAIPMLALGYAAPEDAGVPVHSPGPVTAPTEAEEPERQFVELVPGQDGGGAEVEAEIAIAGVGAFKILDESTGEVHTVPVRDFVRGAVAAEMPVTFHSEALKAQAVAAHTYALHNHRVQQDNPDPSLRGADFSANPSNMKVYMTEETARGFYGANADEYWGKICAAADEVVDYVLEYGEEPIVAAYHAMSSGVTEDASNVWTGSADYLVPAQSGGDLLAPDYETEAVFSEQELRDLFLAAYPAMDFSGAADTWIGGVQRSDSGYVTAVTVGGVELHGLDVRTVLGLRSHNFECLHTDQGFVFAVYGYGHGVGLSQYGADFMARQGADYRDILEHYYAGANLCRVVYAA